MPSRRLLSVILGLAFAGLASAQIIVDPPIIIDPPILKLYPQVVLTPSSPTTNDSVSFWLILGEMNSSCYPRYTSSSTSATSGANTILKVKYVEQPSILLCRILPNSVQYGPRFSFGKLPAGNYTIVDSTKASGKLSTDTLLKFTVATVVPKYSLSGTVRENSGPLTVITPCKGAKLYLKQRTFIPIDPIDPIDPIPLAKSTALPAIVYPLYTIVDSATADANGAFAFPSTYTSGNYLLSISDSGYVGKDTSVSLTANTTLNLLLDKIKAYCKVTGRVTRACPSGICILTPVESCLVTVSIPLYVVTPLAKSTAVSPIVIDPILPPIRSITYSGFTNSQGYYTIDSIPVGDAPPSVIMTAQRINYTTMSKDTALVNGTLTVNFPLVYNGVTAVEKMMPASKQAVGLSSRWISFTLANAGKVTIRSFGIDGRSIPGAHLVQSFAAGTYQFPIVTEAAGHRVGIISIETPESKSVYRVVPDQR